MIAWLLALACSTAPAPVGELVFVRDGLLVPSRDVAGQPVGGDRTLMTRAWTPGETVSVGSLEATAPVRPECLPLFHVPLGDVSKLVASGGVAPNSSVAFSPDGSRLAVGSHQGDLVVVDGWTGEEVARTVLAEALVKRVAWSPDGATLYAGEQSPDAELHAFDAQTLKKKWSFRAADHVESSPLPDGDGRYAIFELPGIYTLRVLNNGDVLAIAVHGWTGADGARLNQSQVFRLNPEGTVVDRWPDTALSATLLHSVVYEDSEGNGSLLLNTDRSADGPPPNDIPVGGLVILSLPDLSFQSFAKIDPLGPWFKSAYLWQAMDMHPTHGLFVGLGDGRAIIKEPLAPHADRLTAAAGTPIMAGKVPISASVGFGQFLGDSLMYTTSDTNIPWGAAVPELRPPSAHPGANGLWVTDTNGTPLWNWQGNVRIQGLSASPDQQLGIVGGGYQSNADQPTTYGAVLFDLTTPEDGRPGTDRRLATCATANPVYFEHQILDDGRIAVVEFPSPDGQGGVRGSYRATVLR